MRNEHGAELATLGETGKPVWVGLIGAGKFGSKFLPQAPRIQGLHALGIADRDGNRARRAAKNVGWPAGGTEARSLEDASRSGGTFLTDGRSPAITCRSEATCSIARARKSRR